MLLFIRFLEGGTPERVFSHEAGVLLLLLLHSAPFAIVVAAVFGLEGRQGRLL